MTTPSDRALAQAFREMADAGRALPYTQHFVESTELRAREIDAEIDAAMAALAVGGGE